ncbi:hypothetical protein MMC22_005262 [Lobaria immixta]|nr:hypothetical protein [Lobaria immixta]
MDPLSAIASVIAIYQLASKVGEMCFLYAQGVRGAQKESDIVIDEIMTFQKSLLTLKRMLSNEEHAQGGGDRLKNLEELMDGDSAYLQQCKRDLEKMLTKLESSKMKEGVRAFVHKLSWPLKEEEVSKVTERLRGVAAAIDRALHMDNTEMLRDVDATTRRIQISLENTEDRRKKEEAQRQRVEEQKNVEEMREKIFEWLEHPRPQENHDVACRARNDMAKTGRWFLDGDTFKEFKDTPRSLLCLHGESGCGKTVLVSAIIEELQAPQDEDTQVDVAYWYYYANDKKRTSLNNLVRALITQFIPESSVPTVLVDFWKAKKKGKETPKTSDLVQTLRKILVERSHRTAYIVVDALDESDDAEREELMEMLRSILDLENVGIHILVTGRRSMIGIEKESQDLKRFYSIGINREHVNLDILAHITERLQNDKILKTWPEKERQKIKSSLVEKAAGMFRWVDCQLQAIRKCKKPADLNKTLNTLPKDVHEQYARELAGIPESSSQDALKILQWLTFPQRKLRLEEIIDMIAVDLYQEPPVFDEENRLWDPEGIHEICGSLVRVDLIPDGRNSLGEPAEVQTLTIAHTTVLDFLKTQPIRIGSEHEVRFKRSTINLRMAETCLVYLRYFIDNDIELTEDNIMQYPLARFCAEFWDDHYREVVANDKEEVNMTRINEMIMALFHSPEAMLRWIRLCDPDDEANCVDFGIRPSDIHSPIYYAALLGLPDIVLRLIDEGAKIDDTFDECYGTPLVAASFLGRKDVVSLLLEKGADPNLSGFWFWGCPLASAVEQNRADIVKMLLNQEDIDINCRRVPFQPDDEITEIASVFDSEYGETMFDTEYKKNVSRESMVYIATAYNSPEVLEVLLEAGADPNIKGGEFSTALQAACNQQKEDLVWLLLDSGADPNIQHCGKCDNALQQACSDGNEKIVRLLLERGADPNLYGGHFGGTFQAGCFSGNESIVRSLLEKGVDTEYRGGAFGTPLQTAIESGSETVVKFLLDSGEPVNEKYGMFSYPVAKASSKSKDPILRILLENGANPNQELEADDPWARWFSTPLQFAFTVSTTALLLDYGARINVQEGYFGTALVAAIGTRGKEQGVAELLISRGADVNVPHWRHGTPLGLACSEGDQKSVNLLLKNGANLEQSNMSGQSPLCRAICNSQWVIVDQLINLEVNPNSLDKRGCSYLHYAARACNDHGLKKFMSTGLDVNGVDSNGWSPLHWAASSGYGSANVIKTLLRAGGNKYLKDKQGRTALDLAILCGKYEEVKILMTNRSACGDLPETDDGERFGRYKFGCDICGYSTEGRKSKELEYKDILHPKDHEFTTEFTYDSDADQDEDED